MSAKIIVFLFFILHLAVCEENYSPQYLTSVGEAVELKFYECVDYLTGVLEGFNDRRWGKSELGKLLHYDEIKPKFKEGTRSGKSMKKMSMAMMPLIFHMGASSTWMLLTSIMAAKSVAIGLILLVFKIAVSSAKVASFFTTLKSKHASHHPEWSWSPPEYGQYRSFSKVAPTPEDWSPYQKWSGNAITQTEYKTIPLYKNNVMDNYDKQDTDKTNKYYV